MLKKRSDRIDLQVMYKQKDCQIIAQYKPKLCSVGARKRHGGGKNDSRGADGDKNLRKKIMQQNSVRRQRVSPTLLAVILVLLVAISVGVYVFNFVDISDLVNNVQKRFNVGNSPVTESSKTSSSQTNRASQGNIHEPVTTDEAPVKQAHVKQDPVKPDPVKQDPVKPDPVKPDPVKQNPVKQDPVPSPADTPPKKSSYAKAAITNKADNKIRQELDEVDTLVKKRRAEEAVLLYDKILARYPKSPRGQYGKAEALDILSEQKQSNPILEQCVQEYLKLMNLPDVPKELMIKAAKRCVNRQTFRGWSGGAVTTLKKLIEMYPEEIKLWNELGVQYLLTGKNHEAKAAFQKVLDADKDDGYAKVHIGFIIKTSENNPADAIPYLTDGINSNQPGTQDGRFYFHLGDALNRVGRNNESYALYEKGAAIGLFRSKWQRSLYNVDTLTGRPWWTPAQTGVQKYLKILEDNWKTIRDEGLSQMDPNSGAFTAEDENLREKGDWRQFTLFQQGRKHKGNCQKAPKTCALLDGFPEAAKCKRGQIKYSVMQPGVHVWPHCGPTNCRVRAHLGLVVPEGPRIRVTDEVRQWEEGKFLIFDDSFEHEVWHDGEQFRLVLIVDFWHPELTAHQRATLSPI